MPHLTPSSWRKQFGRPSPPAALANRLTGRTRPPRRVLALGNGGYPAPLFPGYVFARADAEGRAGVLAGGRVVRTLAVADQAGLSQDLGQIHQLIASGGPITPEQRLVPGRPVEIRSGPLAGLKGSILRSASGGRFVVRLNFIQRGASVLLDAFTLARVGGIGQRTG